MSDTEKFEGIQRPDSLKQLVLTRLRTYLFRHELVPGSIISAKGLSEAMKVSRTPVREAMETLANAGLIRWVGVSGAMIHSADDEEFFSTLSLRRMIEIEVGTKLATLIDSRKRDSLEKLLRQMKEVATLVSQDDKNHESFYELDRAFHHSLATLAQMSRAAAFIDNLIDHGRLVFGNPTTEDWALMDYAEHITIFEAIKGGNRTAISEAFTTHLRGQVRRQVPDLVHMLDRWG